MSTKKTATKHTTTKTPKAEPEAPELPREQVKGPELAAHRRAIRAIRKMSPQAKRRAQGKG